jgi:hypothetical protein
MMPFLSISLPLAEPICADCCSFTCACSWIIFRNALLIVLSYSATLVLHVALIIFWFAALLEWIILQIFLFHFRYTVHKFSVSWSLFEFRSPADLICFSMFFYWLHLVQIVHWFAGTICALIVEGIWGAYFLFSNFRLTAPFLIYSVGWSLFDFRSPADLFVFFFIAISTICTFIYFDHLCFDCRVPFVPTFAGSRGPFVLWLIVPSLTVAICVLLVLL